MHLGKKKEYIPPDMETKAAKGKKEEEKMGE